MQKGAQFGLTHYLAGMCSAEDVLYETNISGAYIVPVGREVGNSLSLLTSQKLSQLLEWLDSKFDFVLVTRAGGHDHRRAEIAKSCDGVVFVINYNSVSRREMLEAKRQIERTGCQILGAVLNNVSFDTIAQQEVLLQVLLQRPLRVRLLPAFRAQERRKERQPRRQRLKRPR